MFGKLVAENGEEGAPKAVSEKPGVKSVEKASQKSKKKDTKDYKLLECLQNEIGGLREEINQLSKVTQTRTDCYVQTMMEKIEELTCVVIGMKEKAEATLLQGSPSLGPSPSPIHCAIGNSRASKLNDCQTTDSQRCSQGATDYLSVISQNNDALEPADICKTSNCPIKIPENSSPETAEKPDVNDKKPDTLQSQEDYSKEVPIVCPRREDENQSEYSPSYSMLVSKYPAPKEDDTTCENERKDELNYSAQKSPSYSMLMATSPDNEKAQDEFPNTLSISENYSNSSLLQENGAAKQTQTNGFYVNGSYPSSVDFSRSDTCIPSSRVYTPCQTVKRIKEIMKDRNNNEVFLTILSWTTPMDYRVNVSDKRCGDILGSFEIKESTFQLAYREGVFDDYETQFIVHYFLRKQRKCS